MDQIHSPFCIHTEKQKKEFELEKTFIFFLSSIIQIYSIRNASSYTINFILQARKKLYYIPRISTCEKNLKKQIKISRLFTVTIQLETKKKITKNKR